jgi:hypothetical protein
LLWPLLFIILLDFSDLTKGKRRFTKRLFL